MSRQAAWWLFVQAAAIAAGIALGAWLFRAVTA